MQDHKTPAVSRPNLKHPDGSLIEVAALGGKKRRFHYCEPEGGCRAWFHPVADYWARESLQDQCRDLGNLAPRDCCATGAEDPAPPKSQTSLAFASCSIAHIRVCNLVVKVKTGRRPEAASHFGGVRFSVGLGFWTATESCSKR